MTKMNDYINQIKDEKIERAIEADSEEKMKSFIKEKKSNSFNYWKWGVVALACIGGGIIGINYIQNNTQSILKPKEIEKSTNKYLSVNYGLMAYKSANEYINTNVDLENLETGKTLNITSDDLDIDTTSEYKYCKSHIEVEKLPFDVYQYTVTSDCENKADDNLNITIKGYTNTNRTNHELSHLNKAMTEGYYTYPLSIDYKNDNYYYGYFNSIKGDITPTYVKFDKEFNMLEFSTLDEKNSKKDILSKVLAFVSDGYILLNNNAVTNSQGIITAYENSLLLCNNDYKKIWEINLGRENSNIHYEYITEDNKNFIIKRYDLNNNENTQILEVAKKDGKITEVFSIKLYSFNTLNYNEYEKLYFGEVENSNVYSKYDEKGNLISKIDLSNKGNSYLFGVTKDLFIVTLNNKLQMLDNNGNTIKDFGDKSDEFEDLMILQDGFMTIKTTYIPNYQPEISVIYDDNEILKKTVTKYDFKGNELFSYDIDWNYGYNMLFNLGIDKYEEEYRSDAHTEILDDKVVEMIYSPDRNGSELLLIYDYGTSIKNATKTNNSEKNKNNEDTSKNSYTNNTLEYSLKTYIKNIVQKIYNENYTNNTPIVKDIKITQMDYKYKTYKNGDITHNDSNYSKYDIAYNIYIENFDKSKCDYYTQVAAGNAMTCKDDHIEWGQYFIIKETKGNYEVIDFTTDLGMDVENMIKEEFISMYLKDKGLLDYRVENVEITEFNEEFALLGYKNTDILAYVTYSVEAEDIYASGWDAGNGVVEGNWSKNKGLCVYIRDGNLNIAGTGW